MPALEWVSESLIEGGRTRCHTQRQRIRRLQRLLLAVNFGVWLAIEVWRRAKIAPEHFAIVGRLHLRFGIAERPLDRSVGPVVRQVLEFLMNLRDLLLRHCVGPAADEVLHCQHLLNQILFKGKTRLADPVQLPLECFVRQAIRPTLIRLDVYDGAQYLE